MNQTRSDRKPAIGLALIALGLAAAFAFLWLEIHGGFPKLREYEYAFLKRLPAGEAAFDIKYLALILPAGLLLGLGLSFLLGRAPFEDTLRRLEGPSDRAFIAPVMLAGATLVLVAGLYVLRDQPVTDDERVYLFQAEILSQGQLYAHPYPAPDFFNNTFIINRDKWYGKYPPGHPLALVPGVVVGFPRLVPALLAALNLLLFYRLALRFFKVRAARAAVLLLLVSPFFLLTGGTLLSHMTCLAAAQLFGLFALKAVETGAGGAGLISGAALGFAFITRPYTAVLIGGPVVVMWGWQAFRKKLPWRPWLLALAAGAVFLGAFLAYNAVLTGNPLKTGYSEVQKDSGGRVIGFGELLKGKISHTPLDGLMNVGLITVRLNFWTWGWPLGWLFVIAALLWVRDTKLRPLWAILAATALGSIFYFSIGVSDTGPVKFYEILPVLTILTVIGAAAFDSRVKAGRKPGLSALAPALIVAFCALGWGFFGRIQIGELRRLTDRIAEPYRLVARQTDNKLLVFVGKLQEPPYESWVFSAPNNLPDHDKHVLYVTDQGFRNRELIGRMPERVPLLLKVDAGKKYSLTRLSGDEATRRVAESAVQEGILFLRDLKVKEAVQKFAEAIRVDPGYGRSYLLLGWALEQARKPAEADQAYKKAIELDPNQPEWYFFYGRFLGRQGRFKEAEQMLLRTDASPEAKRIMDMVRRGEVVP